MTCKLLQWEVIAYSALDTGKHEGVYTEYLQLTTFLYFSGLLGQIQHCSNTLPENYS